MTKLISIPKSLALVGLSLVSTLAFAAGENTTTQAPANPQSITVEQLDKAPLIPGEDYFVLDYPAYPQKTVEMAMSYSCSHCEEFTTKYKVPQKLQAFMAKNYPTGVFNEFHVVYPTVQKFKDEARLRAVLQAVHRDDLNEKAFRLSYSYTGTNANILQFLQQNLEKTEAEVRSIWSSFSVNLIYKKEQELTEKYNISATPTFIINGRYQLNLARISRITSDTPLTPEMIGDIVVNRIARMLKELP